MTPPSRRTGVAAFPVRRHGGFAAIYRQKVRGRYGCASTLTRATFLSASFRASSMQVVNDVASTTGALKAQMPELACLLGFHWSVMPERIRVRCRACGCVVPVTVLWAIGDTCPHCSQPMTAAPRRRRRDSVVIAALNASARPDATRREDDNDEPGRSQRAESIGA